MPTTDDWGGVAVADEPIRDDWGGVAEVDDWGGVAVDAALAAPARPLPFTEEDLARARRGGDTPINLSTLTEAAMTPKFDVPHPSAGAADAALRLADVTGISSVARSVLGDDVVKKAADAAGGFLADNASFFTSPVGILTAGAGLAPKAVQAVVGTGFAADMLKHAPEAALATVEAAQAGDVKAAVRGALDTAMGLAMPATIGSHLAGRAPVAAQQRLAGNMLDLTPEAAEAAAARRIIAPETAKAIGEPPPIPQSIAEAMKAGRQAIQAEAAKAVGEAVPPPLPVAAPEIAPLTAEAAKITQPSVPVETPVPDTLPAQIAAREAPASGAPERMEQPAAGVTVAPTVAEPAAARELYVHQDLPAPTEGAPGASTVNAEKPPVSARKPQLRSAFQNKDGTVYIGDYGQQHPTASEKIHSENPNAPRVLGESGFATPDGEFLTRDEAFEWVKKNRQIARQTEGHEGKLDFKNYVEANSLEQRGFVPPARKSPLDLLNETNRDLGLPEVAPVEAPTLESLANEPIGQFWYQGIGKDGKSSWVTSNLEKAKQYSGKHGGEARVNVFTPEQVGETAFADRDGNLMSPSEYARTQSQDTTIQTLGREGGALPEPTFTVSAKQTLDPAKIRNLKLPETTKAVVVDVLLNGKSVKDAMADHGFVGGVEKAQKAVDNSRAYAAAAKTVEALPKERSYADQPGGKEGRANDPELESFMRQQEGKGGFVVVPSAIVAKLAPETSTTPNAYRVGRFSQGVRNWWFGKGGALPKPLRQKLTLQRQNIDSIKAQGGMLGKDIQLDIERVKRGVKNKTATQTLVNEVLDGNRPMTDITDPGLRDSVGRARNFIDALTKTTLDNGIVTGSMADTFRTNMGKWMRRYYSAFDPEAGRTYDNMVKAAYVEPMRRRGLKDADLANILRSAETEVRGSRNGMTDGEVEAVLRGLLDRETMERVVTGQSATSRVAKDISSLIRRKEIAPAIREWMGEEKNPLLRFEKSIDFMAQLITRHETQKAMRDYGLANELFSREKTGRYTVEVSPDEMAFVPKRDAATGEILKDADGNPLGEFSTRTDKSMDVFRGLYTSPEFTHAIKTLDSGAHGIAAQMGTVGKGLSMFAAETKMAKVPLNPGSWMTNALGGLMMNFANGTGTPLTPRASGKLFSTAFQAMRADRSMSMAERGTALNTQLREMHARLVADGVLNSNIAMRDLEASTSAFEGSLFETNAAANRTVGAVRLGYYGAELGSAIAGPPGAAVGGAVGATTGAVIGGKAIKKGLQKFSQKSIGTADNFWKTVAYLDNFETYVRAGKTPAEAARISSEITRNTMPTYEKIPEGLRSLSRMGFVSTFFQFNYEVIRNTFNTVAIGKAELASGNKVLQARGTRRLAGAATMIAAASSVTAQLVSGLLIDDDNGEKQKALNRSFVPQWDKNNGLIVTKLGNGSASYVNHGYLIPQAQLTRAATAAMNGDGAEEAINNIFGAYVDDFVSAGVHIGPLIEATVNQKGFRSFLKSPEQGSQVSYKRGPQGYWERFAYVLNKTVKPGAVGEVEKVKKAVTGEMAEYGRKYTLEERAVRMMGLRENTYDLNRTLEFKLRDLQSQWRNTSSVERNAERKNLPKAQADEDAKYVKEERARIKEAMQVLKKDAATLGLKNIETAQKKAGVALDLR